MEIADIDRRGDPLLDEEEDTVICADMLFPAEAVALTDNVASPLNVESFLLSDERLLLETHADTVPVAESLATELIENELVEVDVDVGDDVSENNPVKDDFAEEVSLISVDDEVDAVGEAERLLRPIVADCGD